MLNSAGAWNAMVSVGSLEDSARNHCTGNNGICFFSSFYECSVIIADVFKLVIASADNLFVTVTALAYMFGIADSVKFVLSETIQAGGGAVSFKATDRSSTADASTSSEVSLRRHDRRCFVIIGFHGS